MRLVSKQFLIIFLAVIVIGAIYINSPKFFGNANQYSQTSKKAERVWPVKTQLIEYGTYDIDQQVFGEVKTGRASNLSFQISGCIDDANEEIDVGDFVKKGRQLAKLDTRLLEVDLASAKSGLEQLQSEKFEVETKIENLQRLESNRKADVKISKRILARQMKLKKKGVVSSTVAEQFQQSARESGTALLLVENQTDAAKASLDTLHMRMRTAHQAERRAEINLAYAVLKAPHDGVISSKDIKRGSCVTAAAPVLRLVDVNDLQITLNIPLNIYRSLLTQGEISQWKVQALTGEKPIALNVIRKAPELLEGQQMVEITAVPSDPNTKEFFVAGQHLRASVIVETLKNVAKIPYSALYDGDLVYSIKDERLLAHKVTLAYRDNLTAYVQSQIPAGTPVIANRLKTAIPGLKVKAIDG